MRLLEFYSLLSTQLFQGSKNKEGLQGIPDRFLLNGKMCRTTGNAVHYKYCKCKWSSVVKQGWANPSHTYPVLSGLWLFKNMIVKLSHIPQCQPSTWHCQKGQISWLGSLRKRSKIKVWLLCCLCTHILYSNNWNIVCKFWLHILKKHCTAGKGAEKGKTTCATEWNNSPMRKAYII